MNCKWSACGKKLVNKHKKALFCNFECYFEYLKDIAKTKKLKKGYRFKQRFGRPRIEKLTIQERAKERGVSVPTFYKLLAQNKYVKEKRLVNV